MQQAEILESLSKQEKASWLEDAITTYNWVVWCKSKTWAEKIRLFEHNQKEIFCNYDEMKSKEVKKKINGSKKSAYRRQS